MTSSRERFSSIPELLSYLGQFITNRRLLYDLCRTSRDFSLAFIPFLYEEIYFARNNGHVLIYGLEPLITTQSLQYVKSLEFMIPTSAIHIGGETSGSLCQKYNAAIQALLQKLPGLTRFRWTSQPLFAETVTTLRQQCPRLQHLSIIYPQEIERIEETTHRDTGEFRGGFTKRTSLFAAQDISAFANLTSFNLHGIHGDVIKVRESLVEFLINSPNLKALGLSFNTETLVRLYNAQVSTEYLKFLLDLVRDFKCSGGKPLKLSKLHLGFGVIPWRYRGQPASFLGDLTDLTQLEDVSVSNKGNDIALHFREPDGIDWDMFQPSICPRLSIFRVYGMSDSLERWLQDLEPGYLSQVCVEDSRGYEYPDYEETLWRNNEISLNALVVSLAEDSVDYGYFASLSFPPLRGLSVGLWPLNEYNISTFLTWIGNMTDLEQLSFHEIHPHPVRSVIYYTHLGFKIAAQNKRLKYLKLGNIVWRIWHVPEAPGRSRCRLERLDRFEEELIEAFHSTSN